MYVRAVPDDDPSDDCVVQIINSSNALKGRSVDDTSGLRATETADCRHGWLWLVSTP